MKIITKRTNAEELEIICNKNGGIITPALVVDYAKDPKTDLHSHFTWDDTEAAQKWRLEEAAQLIRVCCHYLDENDDRKKVRTFVSLGTDRGTGIYRTLVDVLQDEPMKAQMLEDAKAELNSFKVKYGVLLKIELADILMAIDRIGV